MDDQEAPHDAAQARQQYLCDFAELDAAEQAKHFAVVLLAIARAVVARQVITLPRCALGDHRPQLN